MNRLILALGGLLLAAAGVLLVVTAYALQHRRSAVETRTISASVDETWQAKNWLTDYKLLERSGRTFDSHELAGQVHVASFFFASCPGPCTRQNNQLQVLARSYGAQGVVFLSITCDPKRDNPATLRSYAERFNADAKQWLFLTGELPHIRRIGAEIYGVPVDEMTHTEKFLVYDRWGKQRGAFHWQKADELAQMRLLLDKLLAETEPPPEEKPVAPAVESEEEDDDGLPPKPTTSQATP